MKIELKGLLNSLAFSNNKTSVMLDNIIWKNHQEKPSC